MHIHDNNIYWLRDCQQINISLNPHVCFNKIQEFKLHVLTKAQICTTHINTDDVMLWCLHSKVVVSELSFNIFNFSAVGLYHIKLGRVGEKGVVS